MMLFCLSGCCQLSVMFYFVKLKEKHLCKKTGFLFAYMLAEVLLSPPFASTLL